MMHQQELCKTGLCKNVLCKAELCKTELCKTEFCETELYKTCDVRLPLALAERQKQAKQPKKLFPRDSQKPSKTGQKEPPKQISALLVHANTKKKHNFNRN